MSVARRVVVAAVALIAVAGCSKSPDRLKTTEAERRITTALARTLQRPVGEVTCPADIALKKGSAFQCNVDVDGKTLPVKATQRDDRGSLRVEAEAAVVRTDQIASDLVTQLTTTFGRPFTADCGAAETRIVKPGSTFTCQSSDGSSKRVVTVTVKDVAGTVGYDVGGAAPTTTTLPPTTVPGSPPTTEAPATFVPHTVTTTAPAPTTKPR